MEEKRKTMGDYIRTYGDLAYDIDYVRKTSSAEQQEVAPRPERRAPAPARKEATRQKAARAPQRVITPAGTVLLLFTAVFAVLWLLESIQLYQFSSDVDTLRTSVSELKDENVYLQTQHGLAFDLTTVKAVAESSGMAKPSASQTYYIDLSEADNAVVYTPEPGLLSSLGSRILSLLHASAHK